MSQSNSKRPHDYYNPSDEFNSPLNDADFNAAAADFGDNKASKNMRRKNSHETMATFMSVQTSFTKKGRGWECRGCRSVSRFS